MAAQHRRQPTEVRDNGPLAGGAVERNLVGVGLTETAPMVTVSRDRIEWDALNASQRAQKLARAGAPAIGVAVKLTSEGEIIPRANHFSPAYWRNPEATAQALHEDWFRAGDGGAVDDEGYYSITDRKKDAVVTGGEAAAALVKSGDWVDYGAGLGQPDAFDSALAERIGDLLDVSIRGCLSMRTRAVVEADPHGEHVTFYNWHMGGYDRKQSDVGRQHYIPCNLGEIPDYYRRFIDPVDVMVVKTCPMDADGYFNLSAANLWHGAVASRAKVVVVEIDPALPYLHGIDNGLHRSLVDYVIDGTGQPLPELPNPAPTDADRAVARLIATEIEDGACLQIGIGAMPNAVCSLLLESGVRNLGIHTEMLTDGIVDLYRAGVVTGSMKSIHPGKIVCSFGLGSKSTYDTIHNNPDISSQTVDMTNLPHLIIQNDRLTAINNTTQMDLQGQAASESNGHRHISGSGGQLQFVRAAYASKGGKSFVCMSSTYERNGERRSRVVLNLSPGNIVTAPRSDMMYVVTEFGVVNLKGKSVPERAKAMISLAHPDFRDDLARDARANGLLPRSFA